MLKERPRDLYGKIIHHVTPIILGGDPTSMDNVTIISRDEHFQLIRYWNSVIRNIRVRD